MVFLIQQIIRHFAFKWLALSSTIIYKKFHEKKNRILSNKKFKKNYKKLIEKHYFEEQVLVFPSMFFHISVIMISLQISSDLIQFCFVLIKDRHIFLSTEHVLY